MPDSADRTWRTVEIAPITVGRGSVDDPGPSAHPDLRRTLIGPYLLEDKLGEGGMGAVYRARHVSAGEEVALKVVTVGERPRHELDQVAREAMAAAAIRHPNVVAVRSFGEDAGRLYLALELVPGGDSKRLIGDHPHGLPEARVVALAHDASLGLAAIHRAGLLHRDIKPANIFLAADGSAKLADFGLARARQARGGDDDGGLAVGTPAFMAPEQARREALDERTDIHALGATMFFWATGEAPFQGDDPWDTMRRVADGPTPDPRARNPRLSTAFAAVVRRAMAHAPSDRWRDAQELAGALAALRSGRVVPEVAAPTPRRRRPLAAAALLAVAVVGGGIAIAARPSAATAATATPAPAPRGDAPRAPYEVRWLGDPRLRFGESGDVSYAAAGARVRFAADGALTAPDAAFLGEAIAASDEFAVEVVLKPADLVQAGPARVLAWSLNARVADLVLGQSGTRLEARVRTTATDPDGTRPSLVTAEGVLTGREQHVVLTRIAGVHRLYVDGVRVAEATVPGTLAAWQPALPLVVGNEHRGGFPWHGELARLALAACGWDDDDVMRRYVAWCDADARRGRGTESSPTGGAGTERQVDHGDGDGAQR